MGNPVLARYSIRSKQEYIFKTNRLVEIDGASKIIAGAFVVLFECVENCQYRYERAETPVKFDLADVLRRFGEKSLDMLELYEGGGNCAVLYRDMDVCRNVNMSYTRRILEDFPGLLPMYAGVELDGKYNYAEDMEKLKAAEEIEKNQMFPGRGGYALPFSKMDRVTFQPLSGFDDVGGQRKEFSAESLSKRRKYKAEQEKNGKNGRQNQEGRDLDDIGRLLAIVHADGNNMGLKIRKRLDGETDYNVCVNAMRDLTREIRAVYEAGRAALQAAYLAIPVKKGEKRYPIRWIVSEGDDATFICNAEYAERLTEAYLRGVRDYRPASGEVYSACAGISVFHAHYPCSRAYAVAEQACDNAKKPVHDSAAKGTPSEDGWLDFHIIKSGVGGDLDDLRLLRRLTEKDKEDKTRNRCIMRPWQVCGTIADKSRDIRTLEKLARVLDKSGVTRGNLITLGAAIEADAEQGQLEWGRICYRNDLRVKQDRRGVLWPLRAETAKLYKDWSSLSKALYDLSEAFDIWYDGEWDDKRKDNGKEAAE